MVQNLLTHALTPSTRQTYQVGLSTYLTYCQVTATHPLPLLEVNLQRFVASHHALAYKTIKVYLAAIQYWSITQGFDTSLSAMPRLFSLLRAVRRIQGNRFNRPRRLPITLHHMYSIHHRVNLMRYNNFQKAMFRAATSLAFFGLLHVSEYTAVRVDRFMIRIPHCWFQILHLIIIETIPL